MVTTCIHCPNRTENQYHVMLACAKAKSVWKYVSSTIEEILQTHSYKLPNLICGQFPSNTNDCKKKMVLTLIQIVMHSIWLNRCSFVKKDSVLPTLRGTKNIIKNTFHKIICNKFWEMYPHKLAKFEKLFCHTPRVCRYDSVNELLYTIILE